jgi:hypothetical protein
MSGDIVARLRSEQFSPDPDWPSRVFELMDEAADEIIRLQNRGVYLRESELKLGDNSVEFGDIMDTLKQRRQLLSYAMMIMDSETIDKNDVDTFMIVTGHHLKNTQ